jgi:hypothetical protein
MTTIEEHLNNISPEIVSLIKDCDVVVGGSTALYYYMRKLKLNPIFRPTDTDFFVGGNQPDIEKCSHKKIYEFFNKLEGNKRYTDHEYKYNLPQVKNIIHINKNIEKTEDFTNYTLFENMSPISPIKQLNKIDVVMIDPSFKGDTINFIKQSVDLDILDTYYSKDGLFGQDDLCKTRKATLLAKPNWNEKEVNKTINYYKSLINKKFSTNQYDPQYLLSRIKKYSDRGFDIDTSKIEPPECFTFSNRLFAYLEYVFTR